MQMIAAEIGQNHMGDMNLAIELIRLAKENGADLAKFQLYDHNILYRGHPEIPDVALNYDNAKMLFEYGVSMGIEVFFSVFDVERIKWCEDIGVKRYKIAKTLGNWSVIRCILSTGKPVISSQTVYAPASDIKQLFCVSEYPAKPCDYLLDFNSYDGVSDHTVGLDLSRIALSQGAEIIEKHFAIDYQTGIDAPWSMTPDDLKELKRFEGVVNECRWDNNSQG